LNTRFASPKLVSMAEKRVRLLQQLARLYGVQTVYYDALGGRRQVAPHSLLAALRALGAPVTGPADVPGALRERRQEAWRRCCEPVTVVWDAGPAHLELRLPAGQAEGRAVCRLELENGNTRCWTCEPARLPVSRAAEVEGVRYVVTRLVLPSGLPWGYHRFTLALPTGGGESLVVVAPRQAYPFPAGRPARTWGVFIPLYALHSARSWGAGDLTDLEALLRWVGELGGGLVGTLPLLPTFLDEPFDPSPYAPVSRLFWNEFYLDVTRIPELERCPEAQQLLSSPAFLKDLAALRAAPLVDYRRGMAAKRRLLEHLARCCFAGDSERQAELRRWAAAYPAVEDYSRFRAAVEYRRATWPRWPARMRSGVLREGDYEPDAARYHLYVQWVAHEQMQALAAETRRSGPGLYLDLPLGVHGAGYDVWRERAAFALEAAAGAPPDAFFSQGQDWGFPPLHPERIREQGYRYYIACLRHHLRHAGVLRLDHVMGLHRLFWIPRGLTAREGVYVHYHAEEFYAILALESHRHRTLLVGEDLGTVPRYVRTAMARHKVHRTYVLPFELPPPPGKTSRPVPADAVASLNTHDTPPFAAFWLGRGAAGQEAVLKSLRRKGWLPSSADDTGAVLGACLAYLAASRARIVLVNLEDLWLETAPQNVPGTGEAYPNWRRKARYPFEALCRMPEVLEILQIIDHLRRKWNGGRGRKPWRRLPG